MTDLNQALVDIREIRQQVASTTQFRGYGPATLFATACTAVLVGAGQSLWLRDPGAHPEQYIALWLGTAVVCAAMIATQMLTRASRMHSGMGDEMIRHAVIQFLPMGVAGAVLPLLLLHVAPATVWLVPGLWQIFSGLGVFAFRQCMPRRIVLAGVWFFITGFCSIAAGPSYALTPVSMSLPYAIGMSLVAGIQHTSARSRELDEDPEL